MKQMTLTKEEYDRIYDMVVEECWSHAFRYEDSWGDTAALADYDAEFDDVEIGGRKYFLTVGLLFDMVLNKSSWFDERSDIDYSEWQVDEQSIFICSMTAYYEGDYDEEADEYEPDEEFEVVYDKEFESRKTA